MIPFDWVEPAPPVLRGVPRRMARAVEKSFGIASPKNEMIEALAWDDQRVPLAIDGVQVGEGALHHAAEAAARECYAICGRVKTAEAVLIAIGMVCRRRGVPLPRGRELAEVIARAVDKGWWLRQIRTEWKRRFEHVSIMLGLTYVKTDPYISREVAMVQAARNRENEELLASCTATNENGQTYTLAELAALGMGNKTLRRGELMTRIRGFEEIASDMRHVGMFWTITCPSKFHSVGGTNAKYQKAGCPTPRDAQAYLVAVWARMRAALHRQGIQPYGFRIAEPHTDGCPHWHMLLFVAPEHAEAMNAVIRAYALEEDGDEDGAARNRCKLVQIEAGKGTAAGYIAKYVAKNIDGFGVGDHKTKENGTTYVIAPDVFGNMEISASQRVTYWSQVWGIRQFQQIGGAPVGVWRELRRVQVEAVANAPEAVRAAHAACQKIESDDPVIAKQASFADYMKAQGGATVGRDAAIKIANKLVSITGRYATYEAKKPVGVYASAQPDAVYEGVHYRWEISRRGESSGVAFAVPRTGVNNCTDGAVKRPFWEGAKASSADRGADWEYRKNRPVSPAPEIVAMYEKYRQRHDGEPSAHLAYLMKKYPRE
ncbi:replication endonuclease [Pseudoduganella sp. FT93W]|uniref:Replication endonuclease n=1 Tax=Duganella fentianensis TaxID=2692177 RepID=A0A845HXQ0_9BURK|nr:replication endonuclease [Duganella fentianensis]MYN45783.1 replication endonuclease [Duganella fentianensis]